jgi:hypothetical protein
VLSHHGHAHAIPCLATAGWGCVLVLECLSLFLSCPPRLGAPQLRVHPSMRTGRHRGRVEAAAVSHVR